VNDLREYRAKRDPSRSPEPAGTVKRRVRRGRDGAPRFVVHEHRARALHWDLRLEHEGVLACWALPKGVPADASQNRLAVRTEDHPLDYAAFEGTIPKGQYGAGTMAVWDQGTYTQLSWTDDEVKVELAGHRLSGRYALFRTTEGEWMIHREKGQDPPGWQPVPLDLEPMLAQTGALPEVPGWAIELKWDGMRVLAAVDGGRVRLRSRGGLEVTGWFPELTGLGTQAGASSMLLDGEVIALFGGRVSFPALQRRINVDGAKAARLAKANPAVYMIFDLLHLDGHSLLHLPYADRRDLLDDLDLTGAAWQVPPSYTDEPHAAILAAAIDQDLEGVIAKRVDAPYAPGVRSPDWRKIKNSRSQTVVIGGYTNARSGPPSSWPGRRPPTPTKIGALLVGVTEDDGTLIYAGKVGTGLTETARRDLHQALGQITRTTSPFTGTIPKAETASAIWTEPLLVAEVTFAEWTPRGRMRHPVFKHLRLDKTPEQAGREPQN
jgi:bifunctional non-homologous end joining protein LigD